MSDISKLNISEIVRASLKMRATTFVKSSIRHRMTPLRMLYFVTLTNIFKSEHFKPSCLKTVRVSIKIQDITFKEVGILNRMASLRMLYLVTLI